MKRILIPPAMMLVALLAACSGNRETAGMEFGKVSVEKEVALAEEPDAPSCKVLLEVLEAKGDSAARRVNDAVQLRLFNLSGLTMQQAADSFATQYAADYQHNLAPLYAEDAHDAEKHAWYEYHYNVSTQTQTGKNGVVVYLVNLDYFEGGAHGIQQQLVMNFDASTGRQLQLADIFVPGAEHRLSELLLEKLMDQTDTHSLDELKQKDYLYSMQMFPSENFILGSDELTFIYNPYEIAPYSAGKTELAVSYSEVEELLRK